ncbi:hypothetical protein JNUCC1_00868 [Lentibacillus sp. JNUCC-1]|uniref:sugar phosphate isomerase/epimerase family protein n=1 Tax=Lentibacillus sp. JNUCC-1 TaxID=2654513 RepID=UPI0012E9817F|nr:sugar phosphate isomerase/epimerase family protein [Lentibacillus sp. JNUCC-1]MUV37062.1 hypothetical protein [Lentibacillus sp. JNUCC-1]
MVEHNTFKPTILLPELYFPDADKKGFLAGKIEQFAEEGFYKGVEIPVINNSVDRQRVKEATASANFSVVQWMTALITNEGLDISAVDSSERVYATERIKKHIPAAVESGAGYIALITGPNPKVHLKEKAAESLYNSLCDICSYAGDFGLEVLIEPLDRHVHKKKFIGPTEEAVKIISQVKQSYPNIGLAYDTAHAALNGENIEHSLEIADMHISQLHLSNAVLNSKHKWYGDYHIPLGEPGFMTLEKATLILKKMKGTKILSQRDLRISVEVRSVSSNDAELQEKNAREFLKSLQVSLKE